LLAYEFDHFSRKKTFPFPLLFLLFSYLYSFATSPPIFLIALKEWSFPATFVPERGFFFLGPYFATPRVGRGFFLPFFEFFPSIFFSLFRVAQMSFLFCGGGNPLRRSSVFSGRLGPLFTGPFRFNAPPPPLAEMFLLFRAESNPLFSTLFWNLSFGREFSLRRPYGSPCKVAIFCCALVAPVSLPPCE